MSKENKRFKIIRSLVFMLLILSFLTVLILDLINSPKAKAICENRCEEEGLIYKSYNSPYGDLSPNPTKCRCKDEDYVDIDIKESIE